MLPYAADSYAPYLGLQAAHLLDTSGHLEQALPLYRLSLDRDPFNTPAWLLVALGEERLRHAQAARDAYQNAFRYEPNYAESYWMYANFLLRHGRRYESLQAFRRLLERGPAYAGPTFETLSHIATATEIERAVLPTGSPVELAYLGFSLRKGDPAAASRTWNRLGTRRLQVSADDVTALCRLLPAQSHSMWAEWAAARGYTPSAQITNGRFDFEPIGGPYDWVFHSSAALDIFRDTSTYLTPPASAHLLFTGAGDFDGTGLEQWLQLEKGRSYRLSFAWRTRNLTSDRPPAIELWGERLIAALAAEPGTASWRREIILFTAPAGTVRLLVVRHRGTTPDSSIAGDLWLDDFRIDPEVRSVR